MSKMFTDENGAQWEEPLDNGVPANPTYRIIRPVKQPEWEVKLETDRMIPPEYWINISFLDIKEDQAQLIKEAVEALMEYITDPTRPFHKSGVEEKAYKAWQFLKGDN